LKWRNNSTFDWAWRGLDLSTTVHYLDGFHEIPNFGPQFTNGIKEHWVKQTWFFDVQGSYKWSFGDTTKPWKRLLNRTTVTVGCTNVFSHDPPRANTTFNYAASLYDSTGRFVFVGLKKELWRPFRRRADGTPRFDTIRCPPQDTQLPEVFHNLRSVLLHYPVTAK